MTIKQSNFFPNEKENIELIDLLDDKTSYGMISKGWYSINGEICMVKANLVNEYFVGYEPYSEVMIYKIGKLLGLDVVSYWLMYSSKFEDLICTGINHVSVCKNYLGKEYINISFYDYITGTIGISTSEKILEFIIKSEWFEDISKILILDAFVGNPDRHYTNFDILKSLEGKYSLAPIYDNSAGLLAWVQIINWIPVSGTINLSHLEQVIKDNLSYLKIMKNCLIRFQ